MSAASEFVYTIKAEYAGASDLNKLSDELKSIGQIKSFEKLSSDIEKTEQKLDAAEKKATELKAIMESSGKASDAAAYAKSAAEVDRMTSSLEKQNAKLESNAVALKAAGVSLTELNVAQAALNASSSSKGSVIAADTLLGTRSFDAVKAEIKSLETAYASLAASGTRSDAELAAAHEALVLKTKALNMEMSAGPGLFSQATSSMGHGLLEMGAMIAAVFAVEKIGEYAKKMLEIGDEELQLTARLKLMSSSTEELHQTEDALYEASQRTGTSFAANADVLARMGIILNDTGIKNEALIPIIDTLNQTLVVSGASAATSASFMNAFVYAMDSGGISARQLRTMLKDNPEYFKLLADSIGITVSQLEDFATQGRLTTDVMMEATKNMAGKVASDFANMPLSIERAMNDLHNAMNKIIADLNEASHGTESIAGSIKYLAHTLEENKAVISTFFTSIVTVSSTAIGGMKTLFDAAVKGYGDMSRASEEAGLKIASATTKMFGGDSSKFDQQLAWIKNYWDLMAKGAQDANKKITDAANESGDKQKSKFVTVKKEIEDQYRSMAQNVKSIMDQISSNNFDTQKAIADVRRSGMNEGDAWLSLRDEADAYAKAAQRAAAAGDWATADKDMKAAIADAKALSNEVTVEGERMTARNAKIDELNRLNKIANGILEDQARIEKEKAQTLNDSTGGKLAEKLPDDAAMLGNKAKEAQNQWNTALDGIGAKSKDVFNAIYADQMTMFDKAVTDYNQKWNAAWKEFEEGGEGAVEKLNTALTGLMKDKASLGWTLFTDGSIEQAATQMKIVEDAQIKLVEESKAYDESWNMAFTKTLNEGLAAANQISEALDKMSRDRTVNVYVHQVSDSNQSSQDGYATGGDPFSGAIPGYGGGDRRLILVEDGEHVIRKEAVSRLGHGFFQNFNRLVFPDKRLVFPDVVSNLSLNIPDHYLQAFSDGGPVTSGSSGSGGHTYHQTIHFHGNQSPMSQANAKENARMLLNEMERMNRRRS